ncbi:conserved protein of unknown function [Nitrospira japonica]|uniref:AsmA domain-containing protein n=1 Tax=Nitrospira japonica TaxID=1325564 RepID=A0A1W1I2Y6_9BACT|nr:DUF748 domain-containing protein [Nitrospira japonica]SLM47368.1 conserved protein of unknown function [Nitrospira japonica]
MTVPAERRHAWHFIGAGLGLLLALGILAAFLVDEPLRQWTERTVNDRIKGYHVTIGGLAVHPLTLSVDLHEVLVRQDIHPDPPIAAMPRITADARLSPLLSGKLAAAVRIDQPVFSATKQQVNGALRRFNKPLVQEGTDGWQEQLRETIAFEAALYLTNGHFAYDEGKPDSVPVRIQRFDLEVVNLTNRPADGDTRPSALRLSALLPDESHIELTGRADLLTKPLPAVEADLKIRHLELKNFLPVVQRYNLQVRAGALDLTGRIEHSNRATIVSIEELLLDRARIDYVHSAATSRAEKRRAKKVVDKAAEVHRDPSVKVLVVHGTVQNSEMGFVNQATSPDYRLYISEMNLEMDNFSNRLEEGAGTVKVTGKFMGSGPTVMKGIFRPEKPNPDFDLDVKITKTRVVAFNDMLRAYGDADTKAGTFAFFSELSVKNKRIEGYVKPLLKDVEVYDPAQDKDKALTRKIYEAVVGEVLGLMENTPRDEVVTVTDLSGPVENPQASTWQVVQKLVQNAFFNAILPGFEHGTG